MAKDLTATRTKEHHSKDAKISAFANNIDTGDLICVNKLKYFNERIRDI